MTARTIALALALTIAALLTGILIGSAYHRDAGFSLFNNELSRVVDDVVTVIEANPTSDGVVNALEILNAKKPSLKKILGDLKSVQASQAGGATLREFGDNLAENRLKLQRLITENSAVQVAAKEDPQFRSKIEQLIADYHSIIE